MPVAIHPRGGNDHPVTATNVPTSPPKAINPKINGSTGSFAGVIAGAVICLGIFIAASCFIYTRYIRPRRRRRQPARGVQRDLSVPTSSGNPFAHPEDTYGQPIAGQDVSRNLSPGHTTARRSSGGVIRSRSPRLEVGQEIYGRAWEVEGSQESLIDKSSRGKDESLGHRVEDAEEYGDGIGERDEEEEEDEGEGHLVAPTAVRAGSGTKFVESFE